MPDFYKKKEGLFAVNNPQPTAEPTANAQPTANTQNSTQNSMIGGQSGPMVQPPIYQPLVIVPYSSQMQPLYQYTPEGMPGMNEDFDEESEFEDVSVEKGASAKEIKAAKKQAKKEAKANKVAYKKTNLGGIFAMIFGLLAIALVAVTYFVATLPINLNVTESGNALQIVIDAVKSFIGSTVVITDMLFEIGLAVGLVFIVLTYLVSVFSMVGKYPVIGKIFAVIAVIGVGLMLAMMFKNEMEIGYGAYAITGLTVLMAICAIAAKRKTKVKEVEVKE